MSLLREHKNPPTPTKLTPTKNNWDIGKIRGLYQRPYK